MKEDKFQMLAEVVGPLPPFYRVAYALWGDGVDFDSDGDSHERESTNWRELTLTLRQGDLERVDIDIYEGNRDIISIVSTSEKLTQTTFDFLNAMGSLSLISSF